jgi:SAM-dependent methyltransferase
MNRKERRAAGKLGQGGGVQGVGVHAGAAPAAQTARMFAEAVRHRQNGGLAEADALCRNILATDPDHAGSLHLLGNIAQQVGRPEIAAEFIGKAIALDEGIAAFHDDMGLALHALGRSDEAIAQLRRAISIEPNSGRSYNNLAVVVLAQGNLAEACTQFARALALTPELFESYPDVVATLLQLNPTLKAAVARAMDAWPRRLSIAEMFGPAGLAAISDDPLLRCMLVSATVRSVELERLLTNVRGALFLQFSSEWKLRIPGAAQREPRPSEARAGGSGAPQTREPDPRATSGPRISAAPLRAAAHPGNTTSPFASAVLDFCCALARQCFINEYVFATTPAEEAAAEQLKQSLVGALAAKTDVPPLWPAVVGCYFALGALSDDSSLLERAWPAALDAVVTQQLREPAEERRTRDAIPRLTDIADATSLRVKRQYEENPYPRWVIAPSQRAPQTVDDYLRQQFPSAPFRDLGKTGEVDILIAGCGTGHHPIGMAQRFAGARVLAVDLSLASLAYALRKTRALQVENIAYAQADILKLVSIGRTFDLIDASGVLHHLADPAAGWRALLALLRPNGFMRIGLYSELARRDIVAARAFCAARGYRAQAQDIRAARHDLMSAEFKDLVRYNDFFSTGECRDLLFHAQEHRFGIAQIAALIAEHALTFIGFELSSAVVAAYRQRFPDDAAMRQLDRWRVFEAERPDTFAAMYQFWVQKQ